MTVVNALALPRAYLETRNIFMTSKRDMREMQKAKNEETKSAGTTGFCCPHCADSKFPCVNMEQVMKGGKAGTKPDRRKLEK